MNKIGRFIIVAVVALMAIGGAVVAFAQEDTTATDGTATVQERPFGPGGEGMNCPDDGLRDLLPQIFDQDEMDAVVANALGITVEELNAAKEAGTHLPDLAESLGVDIQTVHDAMQAYRETAVADAVASGLITQEQADQILSHPGHFGPGGHRGPGPRGGEQGQPDANQGQLGQPETVPQA
ncbi:MAG: hypothetical protein H6668_13450 [Ardenticatenaceae bacterium]|nr:hypothetical protein [Ardenticatenaceae bacterium]